jgi:hypothetical protein
MITKWVSYLCLILFAFNGLLLAESIYVLNYEGSIHAFDVNSDIIEYRVTQSASSAGIDLAIDEDSNTLFRTREGGRSIDIIIDKGTELELFNTVTFTVYSTAGIVYDSLNQRLLTVNRNNNELYMFDWNPTM